jgi:hypothetical protein
MMVDIIIIIIVLTGFFMGHFSRPGGGREDEECLYLYVVYV